jgi:hypothetical protein
MGGPDGALNRLTVESLKRPIPKKADHLFDAQLRQY